MAKMLRWEMAWKRFTEEFYGIGNRHTKGYSGYSPKLWRKMRNNHDAQYWRLVKAAQELGVSVWKNENLGTARDAKGQEFFVAGQFDPEKIRIDLCYRAYYVLAHEFAHAIDYLLRGRYQPHSSQELTACAVGYLLTCQNLGIYSPKRAIEYAKRQGATEITLKHLEGHILSVFHEMNSLLTT